MAIRLALMLAALGAVGLPALADTSSLRIATFNTELSRDGPGLMLRDLRSGKDEQVAAVLDVIITTAPDILAVQGVDWDLEGRGLSALLDALEERGATYPYHLQLQPNTGLPTAYDMDGDGRFAEPEDAQSFGHFTGMNGMALVSKRPFTLVADHSTRLWADTLDIAPPPRHLDGRLFPSDAAFAVQRLPHTALWQVQVEGLGQLILFQAGPPVFDGEEDRNGLRNAGELALVQMLASQAARGGPVIVIGGGNNDPADGDGRHEAVRALLSDPTLQDPEPTSSGGTQAGDQGHTNPDAQDTVDWPRVGRLRVDYILPDARFSVLGAGVYWPAADQLGHESALTASRHRLVWVDLDIP